MVGCSQGFGTWWATGISCSEWAETWFNLWDGLKQPTCSEMYDIICDYVILCIHDICLQSYYIMFSYIIIYIIFNLHIYIYIFTFLCLGFESLLDSMAVLGKDTELMHAAAISRVTFGAAFLVASVPQGRCSSMLELLELWLVYEIGLLMTLVD